MLTNLAFKNVGKSIRDYLIYFLTLALGVCVFYMFNSIHAQQAMMNLTAEQSDSVKALTELLNYVSVFVATVLGFLILYANNFFIKRRKKELGIYMTLGMEKSSISMILIMETSLIALLALILGIVSGVFLSQFMSFFTAKIFEADMTRFSFVFSIDALLKSILYFSVIFLIIMLLHTWTLKKYKLIDLIYDERKNENRKMINTKISTILFGISLCMIGTAYYIILKNGMYDVNLVFFSGIVLATIGTLIFFYSLSGLITMLLQKNKRIYLNELNMFVVRQLASKINTNFISISVVCIVLLMTIGIFSSGYSMQNTISTQLKGYAGFDYSFFIQNEDENFDKDNRVINEFNELIIYLNENENVKAYEEYPIYTLEQTYQDLGIVMQGDVSLLKNDTLSCISVSDYNALLALQGKEAISLAKNEYALLTNYKALTDYANEILNNKVEIRHGETNLTPVYSLTGSIRNGLERVMIIVPDSDTFDLPYETFVLNLNCNNETATKAFDEELQAYIQKKGEGKQGFTNYVSRAQVYANAVMNKAMLAFIEIYLGIVFMITCAAILAIQQLTEAADNKYRYDLLEKLGADRKMLNKALFIQILCYFLFPLVLAIVHAIFGLMLVNNTLKMYGDLQIGSSIAVTAIFVCVMYSVYFLITYVGSKSLILSRN